MEEPTSTGFLRGSSGVGSAVFIDFEESSSLSVLSSALDLFRPLGGEEDTAGGWRVEWRSRGDRLSMLTSVQIPPFRGFFKRIRSVDPNFILVFHFSSEFLSL